MVREDQNGTAEERPSFFARLRRFTPEPSSIDCSEPSHESNPVTELDDLSFFDVLTECVTIVDFSAPWCRPCKILEPRFAELARSHAINPRLQFVRVNVDECPGVASAFDVMSIPTLVVFDQSGREIDREVGLPGKRRLAQLARSAESTANELNERGAR